MIETADKFLKGDLSQRIRIFRNDEMGTLLDGFNNYIYELSNSMKGDDEKLLDDL